MCDIREKTTNISAKFGFDVYWIKIKTLQSGIHVSNWYFLIYGTQETKSEPCKQILTHLFKNKTLEALALILFTLAHAFMIH